MTSAPPGAVYGQVTTPAGVRLVVVAVDDQAGPDCGGQPGGFRQALADGKRGPRG